MTLTRLPFSGKIETAETHCECDQHIGRRPAKGDGHGAPSTRSAPLVEGAVSFTATAPSTSHDPDPCPEPAGGPPPASFLGDGEEPEGKKKSSPYEPGPYELLSILHRRAGRREDRLQVALKAVRDRALLGEPLTESDLSTLDGWADRLATCGNKIVVRGCKEHDYYRHAIECCNVPPCPWSEGKLARKWQARGKRLMALLPSGLSAAKVRAALVNAGASREYVSQVVDGHGKYTWKLVTVAPRGTGVLRSDLWRVIGPPGTGGSDKSLRKKLSKFLRQAHHVIASYAALDVGGENGNAHLHLLVYSPFIPRDSLEHWLRSYDCTVPGCKHSVNDRCPECIAARRKCDHKDGDRVRCDGSWNVDIKIAPKCYEALKYAVSCDEGVDGYSNAEIAVATYLYTYKRHRIETYGVAKPGALALVDSVDEELENSDKCCSECGRVLVDIAYGTKQRGFYSWSYAVQRE